jgi:branched-chain amino acid transport system substrate-binding protein
MYYATYFSMATVTDIPSAQSFAKEFRGAFGKDPDFIHAEAYDAATAAVLAIEKAGKADRTAIRDALRHVEFDGTRGHFAFDKKGDPRFAHRSRKGRPGAGNGAREMAKKPFPSRAIKPTARDEASGSGV